MTSVWKTNAEAAPYLEELVKEGLTIREIAIAMTKKFGIPFTVGQVISKLRRLRLGLSRAELEGSKAAMELLEPSQKKSGGKRVPTLRPVMPEPALPPREPERPRPGYAFVEIPAGGCKYEISLGHPVARDMRFCGRPRLEGVVYCEEHYQIALAPSAVRLRYRR